MNEWLPIRTFPRNQGIYVWSGPLSEIIFCQMQEFVPEGEPWDSPNTELRPSGATHWHPWPLIEPVPIRHLMRECDRGLKYLHKRRPTPNKYTKRRIIALKTRQRRLLALIEGGRTHVRLVKGGCFYWWPTPD